MRGKTIRIFLGLADIIYPLKSEDLIIITTGQSNIRMIITMKQLYRVTVRQLDRQQIRTKFIIGKLFLKMNILIGMECLFIITRLARKDLRNQY